MYSLLFYCFIFLRSRGRLTTHQAEHELQITAAMLHRVVHVTRRFAISSQIIVRTHSGGTLVRKITPSFFRVQTFRPRRVVYSISPHVYVAKTSSHHYHVRSERSASRLAQHYLHII